MDLYRVEFARLRAGKLKIISVHDDVYAEDLPELFRQVTGLETRMPRIVGV
jgi:hypothetical protein